MSHKFAKRFLLLLTTGLYGGVSLAQYNASAPNTRANKENIPYTRYGIGELQQGTNVMNRGMGYQSAAVSSGTAINTENPASYAALKFTTYEAGLFMTSRNLHTSTGTYGTGTAALSYLNIGIPVGKHAGLNIGLKPRSRVYYRIQNDSLVEGLGNTSLIHSGDGGLNYAFVGAAGRYGGFSLGANFGYLFGSTRYSSVAQQIDGNNILSAEFSRYDRTGGLYWNAGAQYAAPLSEKLQIRIGATAALNQNLNMTRDAYQLNFRYLQGLSDQDTVYRTTGQTGRLELPATYNLGIQLMGNEIWSVGAEAGMTDWSSFRKLGERDSVGGRTLQFSLGGSLTPDPSSISGYLQRVTYRLGAYYGQDYIRLKNTDMAYYAFTAGASLPFRRSSDRIHIAAEIGRRGTEEQGLIREQFYRFHLGFSLNDKWFIKRKYD